MMEKENIYNGNRNNKSCISKFITGWILFIIALMLIMLLVVVFDRYKLHNLVYEDTYITIVKDKLKNIQIDSLKVFVWTNDTMKETMVLKRPIEDSIIRKRSDSNTQILKDSSIMDLYFSNNNEQSAKDVDSLLDYLKKSSNLIDSNSLTYLVTLIVALLASLLLYRIDAMEKLVAENEAFKSQTGSLYEEYKKQTDSYYSHIHKYDNILTWIESAYNLSIMIYNMTVSLPESITCCDKERCYVKMPFGWNIAVDCCESKSKTNEIIFLEIGQLCSRLYLLCDQIDNCFKNEDEKIDYLNKNEKDILNTYIEDTLLELKKSLGRVSSTSNAPLCKIIETIKNRIGDVREIIEKM